MRTPCTCCDSSAQGVEAKGVNRQVFARRLQLTARAGSAFARAGTIGVAAFIVAESGTAHAAPDVIPGIKHYEVVLPVFTVGPDGQPNVTLSNSSKNMAGDISDRGLLAGRVELTDPGLRAFVWSMVPQFGVVPFTVTWLPMPTDGLSIPFPTSEAFDVSEHGVVLGGVGPITGLGPPGGGSAGTSDWNPRGILWRLGAGSGGGATWQRIDPPFDAVHGYWPQGAGGTTVLEAISAELPLRAVGYAGSNFGCFGGGVGGTRPAAIAIAFDDGGVVPAFWTDPNSRQSASGAPKARLLGVSRRSEFLVGAQNGTVGCDVDATPLGNPCAPTRWDRLTAEDQTALAPTAFGAAVPPRELITAEVRAASRVGSGSTEGIGVGYIFRFNNMPLGQFPQAWKLSPVPPVDPDVPQAQPLQLPFVPGSSTIGGFADDVEGARWLSGASGVPSHIAVGASEIAPPNGSAFTGTLWYWSGSSWTAEAWTAVDVNSLGVLADGWKTGPSDRVERLRGVNQWGDCVGTALVSGVRRPVVLRAIRLIGDLDINDCVGASDLAILLGAWCAVGNCTEPSFASDLNRDGIVGATDLSALLANWGSGGGCPTGAVESPVPALVAVASKGNVDFAAYIVGLEDIDGYRAWAATAPLGTVQVIDEVIWLIAKSRQEAGAQ